MNMKSNSQQVGATLVIALIILLVMTLVGVAGMQGSTLQERMAANTRQQALARNGAELALKEAEKTMLLDVKSTLDLAKFNGSESTYYSSIPLPTGLGSSPLNLDLSESQSWDGIGTEVDDFSAAVKAKNSKYVVEYIGRGQVGSSSTSVTVLNADNAGLDLSPYFFRITAIGWAQDENIYSVLESTYRTGHGDGNFTY